MNIRTLAFTAGLVSIFAASTALANSMSAQTFVTKASIANMFEIESSKLANSKSQNDSVLSFADRMVDDHSKTGDKLKGVLKSSGAGLKPAAKLDSKHQKMMSKLRGLSGAAFDRQYIKMQTDAHKEAVALFDNYAENGTDEELRKFASETLPTLQDHFDHVRKLNPQ